MAENYLGALKDELAFAQNELEAAKQDKSDTTGRWEQRLKDVQAEIDRIQATGDVHDPDAPVKFPQPEGS